MSVVESTKPRLEWLDKDTAKVFVQSHHIADLWWNGLEWFFMPYEIQAGQEQNLCNTSHWSHIKVDTWRYGQLRKRINDQNAEAHNQPEAIRAANNAELESERNDFRDDTKDFAELGAIGKARIWWRTYRLWVQGCTGWPPVFGDPMQHDGPDCPVHWPHETT